MNIHNNPHVVTFPLKNHDILVCLTSTRISPIALLVKSAHNALFLFWTNPQVCIPLFMWTFNWSGTWGTFLLTRMFHVLWSSSYLGSTSGLTERPRLTGSVWVSIMDSIITARKRSLGQGNIFTSVCQEFCSWGVGGVCSGGVPAPGESGPRGCACPGGGGLCSHGGLLLGGCLLWGGDVLPGAGVCSRGTSFWGFTAGGICSWGSAPRDPPVLATAAGSTHPTGMNSCLNSIFNGI